MSGSTIHTELSIYRAVCITIDCLQARQQESLLQVALRGRPVASGGFPTWPTAVMPQDPVLNSGFCRLQGLFALSDESNSLGLAKTPEAIEANVACALGSGHWTRANRET